MGSEIVQGKTEIKINTNDRRKDIEFIQDSFNVRSSVEQLHKMMKEVTAKEFNAGNVNAACHCVHQLNEVINTTIKAARFLRDG